MSQIQEQPIRILIVEDHVILRDGLVSLLQSQEDFEVVGEAGNIAEALTAVRKAKPDIVLMDYGLPDGTGLEATRMILDIFPDTAIVFLTVHEEDDHLFAAIRSGAKGYLLKNIPAKEMLAKLRGIKHGDAPISQQLTGRILKAFARSPLPADAAGRLGTDLTSRELEVLKEMARGLSNKEIADCLFISVHTVKNHVHNILEKLEVQNRRQAVVIAAKLGLVDPGTS